MTFLAVMLLVTFLAVMLLSASCLALAYAISAHSKTLRLHHERLKRLEGLQSAAERREGLD